VHRYTVSATAQRCFFCSNCLAMPCSGAGAFDIAERILLRHACQSCCTSHFHSRTLVIAAHSCALLLGLQYATDLHSASLYARKPPIVCAWLTRHLCVFCCARCRTRFVYPRVQQLHPPSRLYGRRRAHHRAQRRRGHPRRELSPSFSLHMHLPLSCYVTLHAATSD
jgi:hypothetical protein